MRRIITVLLMLGCIALLALCARSFFDIQKIDNEYIETKEECISKLQVESNNEKTLDELNNELEELESKISVNKAQELENWQQTVQKVEKLLED